MFNKSNPGYDSLQCLRDIIMNASNVACILYEDFARPFLASKLDQFAKLATS